jgi:acetyl esterase/lipase
MLLLLLLASGAANEKLFQPTSAQSHHNLRYLPESRYTGDAGDRRDQELVLDLHVPTKGTGPFPVLITVHGGAWSAGDKEGALYNAFMQVALDRGYATVGLNYIRKPKEIVPQVFYDTQDAIRFLRANATRYHLDPTRVGAVGWSAGGWLVSGIGFLGGDSVIHSHQGGAVSIGDLAQGGKKGAKPWSMPVEERNSTGFIFPAWSPEPAWPEQSGQLQAMSYDFSFWHPHAHPASAAVNQWAGRGFHHKGEKYITALGLPYDYSLLADQGWDGNQVHCPPMTSPAVPLTGTATVTLAERVVQFFDQAFGPEGRAPAPEIRPFLRVIGTAPVTVSMLVPDPSQRIHYTTDGSDPTTASPVYDAPFTINGRTVVKALATIAGRKPSGVATATFLPGPVPPQIGAPTAVRLPEAAVGKPYSVTFTTVADDGPVRWALSGEILPRLLDPRDRSAKPVDVMGLSMNPATGVLSGTPKVGGVFWVQIAVGRGRGQLASIRNYLLPVAGNGGSLGGEAGGKDDTNVQIGTLKAWPQAQVDALVATLEKAGCSPVVQDDGGEAMLLVPADQAAKARPLASAFATQQKLSFIPTR